MSVIIEPDERRRVSLGKLGHHSRYLAREEADGTLIFEPAVVMTEFEAAVLAQPTVVAELVAGQDGTATRRTRVRRTRESGTTTR